MLLLSRLPFAWLAVAALVPLSATAGVCDQAGQVSPDVADIMNAVVLGQKGKPHTRWTLWQANALAQTTLRRPAGSAPRSEQATSHYAQVAALMGDTETRNVAERLARIGRDQDSVAPQVPIDQVLLAGDDEPAIRAGLLALNTAINEGHLQLGSAPRLLVLANPLAKAAAGKPQGAKAAPKGGASTSPAALKALLAAVPSLSPALKGATLGQLSKGAFAEGDAHQEVRAVERVRAWASQEKVARRTVIVASATQGELLRREASIALRRRKLDGSKVSSLGLPFAVDHDEPTLRAGLLLDGLARTLAAASEQERLGMFDRVTLNSAAPRPHVYAHE